MRRKKKSKEIEKLNKEIEKLNKEIIEDVRDDKAREMISRKKALYRSEYSNIIKEDIEVLLIEKSRLKCEVYRGNLPHLSITSSVVVTAAITIIPILGTYLGETLANGKFKVTVPYFSALIMVVCCCSCLLKPVLSNHSQLMNHHLRLEVLDELEEELFKQSNECSRGYKVKRRMK